MTFDKPNRKRASGDYDTTRLLAAVDALDEVRNALSGGRSSPPPKFRDDLLQLHQLAMQVFNDGRSSSAGAMSDLAVELQSSVEDMTSALAEIQDALSDLIATHADDESDDDED